MQQRYYLVNKLLHIFNKFYQNRRGGQLIKSCLIRNNAVTILKSLLKKIQINNNVISDFEFIFTVKIKFNTRLIILWTIFVLILNENDVFTYPPDYADAP